MRGKSSTSGGQSADGNTARAEAAPARVAILEILAIDGGRTLSPEELAIELQIKVSAVRYHGRVLELAGLLEVAGEELGPDLYERFYRLKEQPSSPMASP